MAPSRALTIEAGSRDPAGVPPTLDAEPDSCTAKFSGNFPQGIAFIQLNLMHTRMLIRVVVLLLAGLGCPARAQDAGKIVEQYVKAAGGAKALSKIQTLTMEGIYTGDDGKAGTYTRSTKVLNRYYSELLAGDKNLIEAVVSMGRRNTQLEPTLY